MRARSGTVLIVACVGAVAAGAGVSLADPGKGPPKTPAAAPRADKPATEAPKAAPKRAMLHPMIVEVLYAVPTSMEGDSSKDGVRNAAGDEFVELVNPHSQTIQLLGYSIADESQGDKSKVRFTFPALELKPGEVVVVFNGYGASWSGPVGDSKAAPPKKHADFASAYVFTMRTANNRAALNNTGDSISLFSPAGKPVQRVRWGTSAVGGAGGKEEAGVLDESVPDATRSSVQRIGVKPGDAWRAHTEVWNTAFSPGKYELDISEAPSAPADSGTQAPESKPTPAAESPGDKKTPGNDPTATPTRNK